MAPELEGVFVPLRNQSSYNTQVLVSPEKELWNYFTGPKWGGNGATEGLEDGDADFIDAILKNFNLFPTIRIERRRLTDSHEAWVHVIISGDEPCSVPIFSGFSPYPRQGVLTWQNSD